MGLWVAKNQPLYRLDIFATSSQTLGTDRRLVGVLEVEGDRRRLTGAVVGRRRGHLTVHDSSFRWVLEQTLMHDDHVFERGGVLPDGTAVDAGRTLTAFTEEALAYALAEALPRRGLEGVVTRPRRRFLNRTRGTS